MKLGICSTDFAPTTVDELFRKARGCGFDAMQFSYVSIGMDEIPGEVPAAVTDELNAAAEKYGVEIAAVNATFNLIGRDKQRLARELASMDALCDANRRLGCKLLTLCTGSRSTASMWEWHPDNASPAAWAELRANIRPVVEAARRAGLYLGMETEANNVVSTPAQARRFMDEVGYEKLQVIVDCANLFAPGTARPENVGPTLRGAFAQFGGDIVLAHGKDIAESDGIRFAPTGQGIVDYDLFLSLLRRAGYAGPMILHGIYDEGLMPGCAAFMRQKLAAHGM